MVKEIRVSNSSKEKKKEKHHRKYQAKESNITQKYLESLSELEPPPSRHME